MSCCILMWGTQQEVTLQAETKHSHPVISSELGRSQRLGLMELKVTQGVEECRSMAPHSQIEVFSNLFLHCTWDCQSTSVSVTLLFVLYCCWAAFPSSLQYLTGHHFTILWRSVHILPPSHFALKQHIVTWLTKPNLIYEFAKIITQSLNTVFRNAIEIYHTPKISKVNRTVVPNMV